MPETGLRARFLATSTVYRLWQSPMREQKLKPFKAHNDLAAIGRVLDVACGPGTNAAQFAHTDYLGVDLNESYIDYARKNLPGRFEVADVTAWDLPAEERFDCLLVNSFFHHVDDDATRRLLGGLKGVVAEDGYLHVIDLVLPERPGLPRLLARLDRGDHPRPLERCRELFEESWETVVWEPFELTLLGVRLWEMIYFKGRPR